MGGVNNNIVQAKERLLTAFSSGDVKGIALNYAKEAKMLMPNRNEIQGINTIAAFWRIIIKNGVKKVDLDSMRIWESGSTAFEIGKYWLFNDKVKLVDFGDCVAIWRNKNNSCKLYLHQWFSNNPTDVIEDLSIEINEAVLNECSLGNTGCFYITFDFIKCNICLY